MEGGGGEGLGLLLAVAVVSSFLVVPTPAGGDELLWYDDSFLHQEEDDYNATKEPDNGEYLNRTDNAAYYFDSSTDTLTFLEDNQNENETTSNQAGECNYVLGSWTDEDAQYTYGRCISLRVTNETDREVLSRLDVREVDAGPYKMVVGVYFLDGDGNRTGDPDRAYADLCTSEHPGNLVIRCTGYRNPGLYDGDWPDDAEKWCPQGTLWEYESGSSEYRLSVQPPCRDV